MFKAKIPFALISITILPLVNPIPISFWLQPLTYIRITKYTLPDALTLLESILPLALINLPIQPSVNSLTVRLIILEVTLIPITVTVAFDTSSIAVIVKPLSLIQTTWSVVDNTESMPLAIYKFASEDGVFVLFYAKNVRAHYLLVLEDLWLHCVVFCDCLLLPFLLSHWFQRCEYPLNTLLVLSKYFDCLGVHSITVAKTTTHLLNFAVVVLNLQLMLLAVSCSSRHRFIWRTLRINLHLLQ